MTPNVEVRTEEEYRKAKIIIKALVESGIINNHATEEVYMSHWETAFKILDRLEDKCMNIDDEVPKTYKWITEWSHYDNSETMAEYLDFKMPSGWKVILDNGGSYAEVMLPSGVVWGVNAAGDGCSFSHRVDFEEI